MRELTIYAKKRTTKDGKTFYSYLTRLKKKTGEEITASVRFREKAGMPDPTVCPCNIAVENSHVNYTSVPYTDEASGVPSVSHTLWVSEWKPGSDYVDTSMDEFE